MAISMMDTEDCLASAERMVRSGNARGLLIVMPTVNRVIVELQEEADRPGDNELWAILMELRYRRVRDFVSSELSVVGGRRLSTMN